MKQTQEREFIIPQTLQDNNINFVLLKEKEKIPFQQNWQTKTIKYDDEELKTHLENGGNYGIIGGGEKNLIIIDFDNKELQDKLMEKFPETFTVQTGTGLNHLYFFSDEAENIKILDENKDTLIDVQGKGKQVVGPGSIHPNGNEYQVINEKPISYINIAELKALLLPYHKGQQQQEQKKQEQKKKTVTTSSEHEDNFVEICKSHIKIDDVLRHLGIDTSKNPTECPFHSSKKGKCLGFEENVAHCFHCENSWNIFSLVQQYKNCEFKEVLEFLADNFGLRDKFEESRKMFLEKLKQRDVQKDIQDKIFQYIDKSDLAEKIWEIQPYFFDKTGCFWLWRNKEFKWERVDDTTILNTVSSTSSANTVNSKEKNEIVEAMKQFGRRKIPKDIGKRWIQFKDMIYDLETDKQFQANPDYLVTNPLPWKLGENGETPTIDKIFREWVGEENVPILYEIMAYCMLPDYPLSRIFCFVGSGMNGKSKYLELLRNFIGSENTCSTELDTLLNSRFEVTRLYRKLVCQMGETNFNEIGKTSMLKKLSGGDYINYEYKRKTPFEDLNYAKILISTNTLPATTDKTIGFYRRWIIIDFPNQFSEKKDILSEIPEEEMNNLAFKCLFYLRLLLQKREFHNEGTIEERIKKYEEKSNPIEKFIKEYCDTSDPNGCITKSQFFRKLNEWLSSNGYRNISEIEVTKRLKGMGFEEDRTYIDWYSDGNLSKKLVRAWLGVKFKGEKQ